MNSAISLHEYRLGVSEQRAHPDHHGAVVNGITLPTPYGGKVRANPNDTLRDSTTSAPANN